MIKESAASLPAHERYITRDFRSAMTAVGYQRAKAAQMLDLALIGARALAKDRDDVDLFDIARTVVEALDEAGVVFASMSSEAAVTAPCLPEGEAQ